MRALADARTGIARPIWLRHDVLRIHVAIARGHGDARMEIAAVVRRNPLRLSPSRAHVEVLFLVSGSVRSGWVEQRGQRALRRGHAKTRAQRIILRQLVRTLFDGRLARVAVTFQSAMDALVHEASGE